MRNVDFLAAKIFRFDQKLIPNHPNDFVKVFLSYKTQNYNKLAVRLSVSNFNDNDLCF